MKRIITLETVLLTCVLALAFLMSGCAGLQLTDNQDFAVKKLARIAGITLAHEKPGEIEKALSYIEYIKSLDNANLRQTAINIGVKYVYEKYGKTTKTVILLAEVVDLVTTLIPPDINIGTGEPIWDDKIVNAALDGFLQGILLAAPEKLKAE